MFVTRAAKKVHRPNKDHLKFGIMVSWNKKDEDRYQNRDYQIIAALKDQILHQTARTNKEEDDGAAPALWLRQRAHSLRCSV